MSWEDAFRTQQDMDQRAPAALPTASLSEIWNTEWRRSGLDVTAGAQKPYTDAYNDFRDKFRSVTGRELPDAARETGTFLGSYGQVRQAIKAILPTLPEDQRKQLEPVADIDTAARTKARKIEQDAAETASRTHGLSGWATAFAASVARQSVDPINLMTMAAGGPLTGNVVKMLAREALIGATSQAIQEPFVQSARADLGLEAGFGRATTNVLEAAIGGAAFAGLLRGGAYVLRQMRDAGIRTPHNVDAEDLAAIADAETANTIHHGPDPVENHWTDAALGRFVDEHEAGRTFDAEGWIATRQDFEGRAPETRQADPWEDLDAAMRATPDGDDLDAAIDLVRGQQDLTRPEPIPSAFSSLFRNIRFEGNLPDWHADVQGVLDELARGLGLEKAPRLLVGQKISSARGATRFGGDVILDEAVPRQQALATALHEFGHQVDFQKLRTASDDVKAAIRAEWEQHKASADMRRRDTEPLTQRQYRPVTLNTSPGADQIPTGHFKTYLTSFEEWFAEQVLRWATTKAQPQTIAEKFFKGIADIWNAIYARVTGHVPLVRSVEDFLNGQWRGDATLTLSMQGRVSRLEQALYLHGDQSPDTPVRGQQLADALAEGEQSARMRALRRDNPELFARIDTLDNDIAAARSGLDRLAEERNRTISLTDAQRQRQIADMEKARAQFTGKRKTSPRAKALREELAKLKEAGADPALARLADRETLLRMRLVEKQMERARVGVELTSRGEPQMLPGDYGTRFAAMREAAPILARAPEDVQSAMLAAYREAERAAIMGGAPKARGVDGEALRLFYGDDELLTPVSHAALVDRIAQVSNLARLDAEGLATHGLDLPGMFRAARLAGTDLDNLFPVPAGVTPSRAGRENPAATPAGAGAAASYVPGNAAPATPSQVRAPDVRAATPEELAAGRESLAAILEETPDYAIARANGDATLRGELDALQARETAIAELRACTDAGGSVRGCFAAKIAEGKVDALHGQALLDDLSAKLTGARARAADARELGRETAQEAAEQAVRALERLIGEVKAQLRVDNIADLYDGAIGNLRNTKGDFGFGNKAPPTLKGRASTFGAAIRSLLARDLHEIATWDNVYALGQSIRADMHVQLRDMIERLRPKNLGFDNELASNVDMLQALYREGQTSGDMRAFADTWAQVHEQLRQMVNAAGGDIGFIENWRLPNPSADRAKVQAHPLETFLRDMRDWSPAQGMRDFTAPRDTFRPLPAERHDEVLTRVYETMRSGGASGPATDAWRGAGPLADRHADPRVLNFKDAASWLAFNEKYGTGDSPFEVMMGHIDQMSKEIAILRLLGPNPEGLKRYILNKFDRESARLNQPVEGGAKAIRKAIRANRWQDGRIGFDRNHFEALWDGMTGATHVPVNEELARGMGEMRHWLISTQMGSAVLSSLSDPSSMLMTARFNGLDGWKIIGQATEMMGQPGAELRGAELGFISDTLTLSAQAADRYMGETIRSGMAAKASNAVIRASGLRRWTAILRQAFAMEFSAQFARSVERPFDQLDGAFRDAVQRYNFTPEDWEKLAQVAPYSPRENTAFLRPYDIRRSGVEGAEGLANKVDRMIRTEQNMAVIETDPVTRAYMLGSSQPGTAGGEFRRAVGMYKTFSATYLLTHGARAVARGWDGSRLGHGALTFLAMSMLGVLAMQAKEIAAGREPLSLDVTTPHGRLAWGKGVLQGGGLGIFGDVFFTDKTKFGNTWAATLLGPQFAAAETILGRFALNNATRAIKGQETHFLGDGLYALSRYTPGSNLWFAKTAFDRAVLNQLQLMVDERAPERFARIERMAERDWQQRYFWRPGAAVPETMEGF